VPPTSGALFEPDVPNGFRYQNSFITPAEEEALITEISRIEFSTFEMRGVVARRRVAFFGHSYDANRVSPPLPHFLLPLRHKIACWASVDADAFAMSLINEYPPGAPIGWHRDAPQYGITAGVSLLSSCRMRLRPYISPGEVTRGANQRRTATHEIPLEQRSAYLLTGDSRNGYEHQIPPVRALRYSITFRTLRAG
jgi:alkylated DNA repair dioxygenase AlkB